MTNKMINTMFYLMTNIGINIMTNIMIIYIMIIYIMIIYIMIIYITINIMTYIMINFND